jgi:Protein of unknown function (DUF2971)
MSRPQTQKDREAEERWLNEWHDGFPEFLYKYTSLDGKRRNWFEALVKDSVLYFSEFRTLNDPFDGLVTHEFIADDDTARAHWRHKDEPAPDLEERIESLLRFAKSAEGQRELGQNLLDYSARDGVYCVTKKPDDLLMWSYYADGHKGLCLKFRTRDFVDHMVDGDLTLTPVRYSAKVPRINFYESATRDYVQAQIGTKSEHWRHEEEWRLFAQQRSGLIPFPPSALCGIILGCRMFQVDEEFVTSVVRAHRPAVPIVRAKVIEGTYGVEIPPA